METRSKRRKTEPIVEKIRRGDVSVFVAVAEALPEVFRTHVVPKLGLHETLTLAKVNKFYNAAVWSVEAVRSLEEKAENYAKLRSMTSFFPPLHACSQFNNVKAIKALISSGADLEERTREGAKPNPSNIYGRVTALHVAADHSNNSNNSKPRSCCWRPVPMSTQGRNIRSTMAVLRPYSLLFALWIKTTPLS